MKTTYTLLSVTLFLVLGCSSTFKVTTQPEAASVYLVHPESGEKTKVGDTPINMKSKDFKSTVGEIPGAFATIQIEKEGFATQNLWVPLSASGSLSTEISLHLKEDKAKTEEMKTADRILEQIFLAQQFARTQQFERALIEIDKVLEIYPGLSRAQSMKGAIYFAQGNMQESLTWYEKALQTDPELTQAVEMTAKVRKSLNLPQRTGP